MSKTRIVAFGDAVTLGISARLDVFNDCFQYGTTTVNMVRESQTWRSILARIIGDWIEGDVEVISTGMAEDTSQKGLARLERDVLSQSSDYVLVMFGAEDALQCVETAAFRENLEKIVEGIAAQNARPVLMTPTPISERMTASNCTLSELRCRQERLSALAQAVRSLAEEMSIPAIDLNRYFMENHLAYGHLFNGWLPDGVAQSGMASFIAGELLPMLGVNDFPKPTLCDYRKVYSDAEHQDTRHSGFTDLTYFQGNLYVAFRSGHCHGLSGSGGKLATTIVLRSEDGVNWTKDAVLYVEGFVETRDPKFLHVDDRLLLYGVCWPVEQKADTYWKTYGFERLGTGKWSKPFKCAPYVFWRPIKWRGQYMVAGSDRRYDSDSKQWHLGVKLLRSPDGHTWESISTILGYDTDGNETDLLVENDTLIAFSRAEQRRSNEMLISTYIPEENRWETISSGRIIHAPCVFRTGDRIMLTGRYCSQSDDGFRKLKDDWRAFTSGNDAESAGVDPVRVEEYHHGLRTGIFVMDGTRPRLVMELLSAGDSSYTGAVQYGDEYVISDYSMHEYYPSSIQRPGDWETPCDIYISRIRFGR